MNIHCISMKRASIAALVFAVAVGASWAQHGHGGGHGGGYGHGGGHGGGYGHGSYGHGSYGHGGYGHGGYGWYGHGWGYWGLGYGGYSYGYRSRYWGGWWGSPFDGLDYGIDGGLVDFDVSPEEARVIVDGQDVGEADDFDGNPALLPLSAGRHRVELRRRGYRTLVMDVTMEPGWVLRLDDELPRGNPSDVVRRESAPPRSAPYDDGDSLHELPRAPVDHGQHTGRERMSTVRLLVDPTDALVYVDGELRGSVADVSSGLSLPRGAHDVRLEREGYLPKDLRIVVRDGTTYLSVALSTED